MIRGANKDTGLLKTGQGCKKEKKQGGYDHDDGTEI